MSEAHTNSHSELGHRIGRLLLPEKLPPPINPVLLKQYPFGLLTMIVSLEAIFLATFVMIS
jgi:hypothetical protein